MKRLSALFAVALLLQIGCGDGKGTPKCQDGVCDAGGQDGGSGSCTSSECGPAPGAPSHPCWDGTIAGPVCERNDQGQCGYHMRSCPPRTDAGTDGGADADAGGCPVCENGQVCNTATGECVDCVTDAECGDNASCDPGTLTCACDDGFHDCEGTCSDDTSTDTCGDRCTPCPTDPNGDATCETGMCGISCRAPYVFDDTSMSCVECAADDDCTDPAASTCDGGTCVACADSTDCAHLTGTPVCDGGTCVECTPADASECNGNSCDPSNNTCTTTPVGSVSACQPCVADSECTADHACVPMMYDAMARSTAFCLPMANPDCQAPYATKVTRTSVSGAMDDYCTLNESIQTCEAFFDYGSSCADAADCGAAGLDDGLCEPIDFDVAGCTLPCTTSDECPSNSIGCGLGGDFCGSY